MRKSALVLALATTFIGVAFPAGAATWPVTKTSDTADGVCDADCSLREAVIAANANPGFDGIYLAPGTYTLTIPGQGEDAAATGDLDITGDTYVLGSGASVTTITGAVDGLFDARVGGVDLTFDAVRLANGVGPFGAVNYRGTGSEGSLRLSDTIVDGHEREAIRLESAAGLVVERSLFEGNGDTAIVSVFTPVSSVDSIFRDNEGKGIEIVSEASTLTRTTIQGNRLEGVGFTGRLVIEDSAILGNRRGGIGGTGAIPGFPGWQADLTLVRTTVADNTTDGDGAGLHSYTGTTTIDSSTFSGNHAQGTGGAISIEDEAPGYPGSLFLTNTTLSGNTAGVAAGGIHAAIFHGADLNSVTIAENQAPTATALQIVTAGAARPATLSSTLILGSCWGATESHGGNLESPGSTCGLTQPNDQSGVADPRIGPLAENGGPTLTHGLLLGSPAIDQGTACLATDQRGTARPQGGNCDVGAFERVSGGCAAVGGGSSPFSANPLLPLAVLAMLVLRRPCERASFRRGRVCPRPH